MEPPVQPVLGMDLPDLDPHVLGLIRREALSIGISRMALVGGAVRDGLLHHQHRDPWRGLPDLDLVVEGDAVALAQVLQSRVGPERMSQLRLHEAFGTAEFELDGMLVDLATARQESYPQPGENPVVQPGGIETDLARRDFTVNAMALLLGGTDAPAVMIDPHGGQRDLSARELAFLHDASVADDPTRVVRAARYVARLGFVLGAAGMDQVTTTVQAWPWSWSPGDGPRDAPPALSTRLRMELELLLEKEPWPQALQALEDWGAFPLLDAGLQRDPRRALRVRRARRLRVPLLPALLLGAAAPVALAARLQLPLQHQRWLQQCLEVLAWLRSEGGASALSGWTPAQWTEALERRGWSAEAIALAAATTEQHWRPLLRWWGRWRHCQAQQSAQDLMAQGWVPGPALGAELRRLRSERLSQAR